MECEAPMLALLDAPFLSIVHCIYLLFFKREAQEPLVLYILELKETKPSSLVEHFAKGTRFKMSAHVRSAVLISCAEPAVIMVVFVSSKFELRKLVTLAGCTAW